MNSQPGYEMQDVDPRLPARLALAMVVFLLLGIATVTGIMLSLWAVDAGPESPFGTADEPAPGPVLQADPRADMQALERRWQTELNSIGWVDRDAGIAHIPIREAMQRTAQAGWREEGGS